MLPTKQDVKTGTDQMDENTPSATITVDEAHRIIGKDKISRGALYGAVNRGQMPALRLGGRILIPRHAFMRWLDSAGTGTAA